MAAKYFREITAGMRWADENHPGWRDKSLPGNFHVAHASTCAATHIMGDYCKLYDEMGQEWMNEHGFHLPSPDDDIFTAPAGENYDILTAEWKAAITGHPSFCE